MRRANCLCAHFVAQSDAWTSSTTSTTVVLPVPLVLLVLLVPLLVLLVPLVLLVLLVLLARVLIAWTSDKPDTANIVLAVKKAFNKQFSGFV